MDLIPLDKNESYWLLTHELAKAFSAFGTKELSTYPDYSSLKEAISSYTGVDASHVCLTAGSDAVIEAIARTFIEKDRVALLPVPTFYGYEAILDRAKVEIMPIFYTEKESTFEFPLEETLAAMEDPRVAALFLCHPNNPLGLPIPQHVLSLLIEKARSKNILLISDEAYFEYGGKTLLSLLPEMPNLIIIRTFSKAFGLSGARVGYCIANPNLVSRIQSQLLPWPIAHTSVFAALAALNQEKTIADRREIYFKQRSIFYEALKEISEITVYPSETNFFLIRVPDALAFQQHLQEEGIAVALGAKMSRFPEAQKLLNSTIRVAIPSPEDMPRVIKAIQSILFTK